MIKRNTLVLFIKIITREKYIKKILSLSLSYWRPANVSPTKLTLKI